MHVRHVDDLEAVVKRGPVRSADRRPAARERIVPRSSRRIAGDSAEEAVARQLAAMGWSILGRNVRVGRIELDIVALEAPPTGSLVIVEVRSRTVPRFGAPEESVDAGKVARLYRAGRELVVARRLPDGSRSASRSFRVDLVSVVRDGSASEWHISRHIQGLEPP